MKYVWTGAACLSLLLFNYNPQVAYVGAFCSLLGFLAIIIFLSLAFKGEWRSRAGLAVPWKHFIIGLAGTIFLTAAFHRYIAHVIDAAGIYFEDRFTLGNPELYLFTLFQTLNEEIVAGALLLFSLRRKWPALPPVLLSTAAALVFAGAHALLYRYLFLEHSTLQLSALASLFAVGVIRNNAILRFGHAGFSWMLHLAWNLVFFGGRYAFTGGNECTQADLFNIIMGNSAFVAASLAAAAAATLLLHRFSGKHDQP